MSGSGGETQTTTSASEPWGPSQPHLASNLAAAQDLYSRGVGGQVFKGSTVVPFAQDTTNAQNMERGIASGSQGAFNDLWNNTVKQTSDGGWNATQQGVVDRLTPIAGGSMMNGNPYLEDIIGKNARTMGDAINLQASGMGRTGSGANQDVLARNIGDMASDLRYQNYNTEAARMDAANRDLFGYGQQQKTNQGGYADMLSGAYGARMQPAKTMRGLGAEFEDLYGRQLNDQLRIFEEEQNRPWNQIARYNSVATGSAPLGGTQREKAQTAGGGGGIGEVLGGALSLLSLL